MKLITFDFEGTLVDFQWKLEEAVQDVEIILKEKHVLEKLRGEQPHYAAIYNFIRNHEEEWGFSPGEIINQIGEIYDRYDLDAASRWQPVAHIREILDRLEYYRLALISNVGRKGLEKVLKNFGLQEYFGFIITRNHVNYVKPHPEGLQKAMHWAGVNKEEVMHIGDSLSDLFAARNAGVKAAVILGGENNAETLLQEKPDLVLQDLALLPEALRELEE